MPFDDTTEWHSIEMSWKEGEDTIITLDGVTYRIVNDCSLEAFASSYGINVLGGYPANYFYYDGAIRNLKVYASYENILPGDANIDSKVDSADAALLAANWLAENATWAMGDFNNDGVVNDLDAAVLAANWYTCVSANNASVPEPSAYVLINACVTLIFITESHTISRFFRKVNIKK